MRGDLGGCQGPGSRGQVPGARGVHPKGGLSTMVATMRGDFGRVPGSRGQGPGSPLGDGDLIGQIDYARRS